MASRAPSRTLGRHIRCPKCHTRITQWRTFSSTPAALSIGPESPTYVDVPKPPQSDYTPKHKLRGFLPVPKGVFTDLCDPKGRVIKEAVERRVAEASNEPSQDRTQAKPIHAERAAYKSRQAESRRRNLREGMAELLIRKERDDSAMTAKSRRVQAERKELVSRPEREDERLTKGSVLSTMLERGPLRDPYRRQRLEEKRRNVEALQNVRSEHRREALHTLYMNAQDFITNEKQLDVQIEKEFGTRENPRMFGFSDQRQGGTSYWDASTPLTTAEMLRGETGEEQNTMSLGKNTRLVQERMKRMAEELTGGKM